MTKRHILTRNAGRLLLILLTVSGSVSTLAQSNVTLTVTASPAAAQPGITTVSVTGSNFPTGTIAPADVTVTVTPAPGGSGPTVSGTASSVVTVAGTTRRVTFMVPGSFSVTSPTPYRVSISGRTTTGTTFASGNSASLTINPPPRIQSLTPSSAAISTSVSVAITTAYTNFVQGATVASFGPGITVSGGPAGGFGPVTVTSATTGTVQIAVDAAAAPGYQHVTVRTGVQVASIDNVFSVTAPNRPPIANPGGGYPGTTGQAVSFDGRLSSDPDGDPLSFEWQFGDGQGNTGATPSHTYTTAGQYTVTLTVRDGRGGEASATTTAQIARLNGRPTARASGPATGTAGATLAFRGSDSTDPDGDPLTYSWDFADGTEKSAQADPSHVFTQAGSYTVSLTVTDPTEAADTASVAVTISAANHNPTANPGGPYTGRVATALTLDGTASSDPDGDSLTYSWDFGDGTAKSTNAKPSHTYASAGTFVVTLTVQDGRGGEGTATTSAQISANGTPTARASGPPTGETGTSLAFRGADSSDPDGDPLTYSWNFGDGSAASTEANPSHAFSQAGPHVVTLTVADPFKAVDSASVSVTVTLANRPPTAVPGGPYIGQTSTMLTLDGTASSDPDGDPITYSWDFGDGTPKSTVAQPTHAYATTGQFVVTLTVKDGRGGETSATTSAQISHTNGKPTARASGPPTGDAAAFLAFRGADSTDPDGDPLTYSWDFGDGSARSTQANPSHAFAQAGPYVVSLTVADSFGASDTASVAVTITVPNRKPTAVPGGPYNGQSGAAVLFDGTESSDPDGDALTYSWEFGDGSALSSASKPSHSFGAGGNYIVSLTVTDTHGASDTATVVAAVTGANRPPTANAGGPYTGEAGVAIAIDGSGSSDPDGTSLTYSWVFGDGTPNGAGVKPFHAYETTGTFTVTLTVTDPGGLTSTASTTATVTASVDRIPPVVTLTGAKQALPGTQVMMTAEATDNVSVASVSIDVNGADPVSFTVGPYQRLVIIPEIAAPGSEIHVHALAKDPSNNEGTADATITVVALPDTSKPTITLSVPPQAAPAASILVTADPADNVAVTGVDFSANTTPIGADSSAPYQVPYVIPADAPIGAVLTFMALASDAAGNHAQATATLTVVGTADNAPPTVSLAAPPTALAGTTIKLVAAAADDSGVASVAFAVGGAHVGTRVTLPYEVSYTIPPTVIAGTRLHAEAHALDGAALEAVASADVMVTAPGQGVLTGAVFDDSIGLPVQGASVALIGHDARGMAYSQTAVSDSRGQYVLSATEGQATVTITKAGWTQLDRDVTIQRDTALHVIDARLTSVGLVSPIGAAAGGTISGAGLPFLNVWQRDLVTLNDPYVATLAASGPTVTLNVVPGSLASDASLSLTPVSRQGLAGLLPVGWTPIAAVEIAPHGVPLAVPASLTVPLPLKLAAGTPLTIAQWDDSARLWRAAAVTTIGQSATSLAASIQSTGQFAWLLADVVPIAPATAVVGDPLPGVDAALVPATATAVVDPQPRIIFYKPGVKSDVRGRVTTSTPLSSGAIARTRILESYDFFSGAHMQLDPTLEDVVLYQVPGTGGKTLVAGYPVAPSLTFEALSLQKGVITVELRAPGALQESIAMIGTGGGSVAAESGERVDVAAGAITGPLPVSIASLTAAEIGVPAPDGFEMVGAVLLDFANTLVAPAALSVPRMAQVHADDTVVVARMQELIGQTRFVAVALGSVSADRVTSVTMLTGSSAAFEGIRSPGRYVFLRATAPIAFASGLVAGTDAAPFPGAVVSNAPTSALVALSHATGRYIAAIPVGGSTLMARNPIMGDSASRAANATAPRQIVAVDFSLVAHFPTVAAVNPQNGAEGVPLSGPIVITFTTPIDAGTATADAISVTSSAGPVAGRREFSNSNTVVTFRSTEPLNPNTVYTLKLTTAIADRFGRAMQSPVTTAFTSLNTIAPPPPPAGSITASIPVNGRTTVTVTQGAAGSKDTVIIRNVTRGTTTPMSVVDPSVGFTVQVDAGITDLLQLVIRDRSGNETVVALPAFRSVNADGSVSQAVTSAGGHIDGPAGIAVDVKSGTFPDGAVVTVSPATEADFPVPLLTAEQRQHFSFSGGLKLDYGGKKPQSYLNVSIPAAPNDHEADRWVVVRQMPFLGETLYDVADTARVIDGKIATSSPPCPGVSAAAVYGFLKANRELSVLTGAGGVIPNPEALNATYALAAETGFADLSGGQSGVAMPALVVAGMENQLAEIMMQAATFCVPVLSGKATAVPNQATVTIDPTAFVAADLELVVTNTSPTHPGQPRHYFRPFPTRISIEGGGSDSFSVQALTIDGTARTLTPSQFQVTSRSFVAVSIANLVGDYRSIVVENLQTGKRVAEALSRQVVKGVLLPVNVPLAKLLIEGSIADTYDIYAVTSSGTRATLTASVAPYDAGGGNILLSGLRNTIDPTPDEIDAYNASLPPDLPPVDRRGGTTNAFLEIFHRTPGTNTLTPAGTITLVDAAANINKTIQGAFQLTFDEAVNNVYYLTVRHLSGVEDRTKLPEFRVTVLNHTQKKTVRELLGPAPAVNDTTVINVYGPGSATPELLTSDASFIDLDPSSPLQLSFSAPIERNSALTNLKLLDASGAPVAGTIVFGKDALNGVDSIVEFIPKNPLPLDSTFTLRLIGVLDLLGRPLPPAIYTIPVKTFTPTVQATYTEMNLDGTVLSFNDLQVLRDNGPTGPRTTVFATSGNDSGFKLHSVDVTAPGNPFEPPNAHAGGGHRTRRLALQTDTLFHISGPPPGCDTHVNNSNFFGHFAMGTASNTDDSSLMFYDVTNPAKPCTLGTKKITTNPAVFGNFQRGTFRTLNLGAGGGAFLKTTTGYAAYMAIRQVGLAAVDVGANIPGVPVLERQTEGLYPGDYSDVIAAAGDRLLALSNSYGSGSTLDVFDPNLSLIASVAVDTGSSTGVNAHQVAYAHDILIDKNSDGEYDDSEVFAFAYVAGRAGITIVDVTDTDSPTAITTFPVGMLARQVAVSPDGRRLYVGGAVAPTGGIPGGDAFYIVDVSNPFAAVTNRIIYKKNYPQVDRIQVDGERPYVYVARNGGIDIIATEAPNLTGTIKTIWYPVDIDVSNPDPSKAHTFLNYLRAKERRVRGAVVELRDSANKVLARTNTDERGYYALHAPPNATLTVVVKAQLGLPTSPRVSVKDGLITTCPTGEPDCAVHKSTFGVRTGNQRVTKDHVIKSGWNGLAYSEPREAGPFAILNDIYQAEKFVKASVSNATFPPLTVDWSPNRPKLTPHFDESTSTIVLNGEENEDTDEYDPGTVLHEWGHYLHQVVGRDDSIAGSHALGEHLDQTAAFGEAFATAFAGLVADHDPAFIDMHACTGSSQCVPVTTNVFDASTSGFFNSDDFPITIDEDPITDSAHRGYFSESTVGALIFTLTSGGAFDQTYQALQLMKPKPAFTSIYSFLQALKEAAPARTAEINAAALAANITASDEFGPEAAPSITLAVTPSTGPLTQAQTSENWGPIDYPNGCTAPGATPDLATDLARCKTIPKGDNIVLEAAGNKDANWQYFNVEIPTAGCYTFYAEPQGTNGTLIVRQVPLVLAYGQTVNGNLTGIERLFGNLNVGHIAFAVGSMSPTPGGVGATNFRVQITASTNCQP